LVAVAAHHDAPELTLQPVRTRRVLLHQGHLVAPLQEVAGEVVADLAAADHDRVHVVLRAPSASAAPSRCLQWWGSRSGDPACGRPPRGSGRRCGTRPWAPWRYAARSWRP